MEKTTQAPRPLPVQSHGFWERDYDAEIETALLQNVDVAETLRSLRRGAKPAGTAFLALKRVHVDGPGNLGCGAVVEFSKSDLGDNDEGVWLKLESFVKDTKAPAVLLMRGLPGFHGINPKRITARDV